MGTIVSWEKKEGDQVSEGDLLCEIETDKATMGFETPEEGYLAKIVLAAGAKDIPIGKLLCIIVADQSDVAAFADFSESSSGDAEPVPATAAVDPPAPPTAASVAPPTPAATSSASPTAAPIVPQPQSVQAPKSVATPIISGGERRAFASPAAKRVAAQRGVDINVIPSGSGMDGMITSKDVENFKAPAVIPAPHADAPVSMPMMGMAAAAAQGSYSDVDLSNMRKTIAKRLQTSKHEIPHYYLTVECQMDAIMKLRADINKQYEKEGVKLSVNDFIIKATALACKRVPECNSSWMDTAIREYHSCDVSVAVDTGAGLITPIVTAAENKGLAEISETVKELAGRAKEGKLQPHEFMGGTITVSNLGMFGISHFTAIINPPQACILAVGGTTKKALAGSDGCASAHVVNVTLSCDHRVVDGAVGAQWLKHFKKFIEQPNSMLL